MTNFASVSGTFLFPAAESRQGRAVRCGTKAPWHEARSKIRGPNTASGNQHKPFPCYRRRNDSASKAATLANNASPLVILAVPHEELTNEATGDTLKLVT